MLGTAMPLPVIPGVVRCAVKGLTPLGASWVNVHHMMYADGASNPGTSEITAMDALLTRLYTGTVFSGGTAWMTQCGGLTQLVQIDYVNLDGSSNGLTLPHPFTSAATANSPSEVAHVLTLITGHRGRRYRGRIYLPAVYVANLTANGNLAVATATATVAQYAGMLSALGAIQWKPVVASYGKGTTNGVPTTWTPFATPITTTRMELQPDVQRRRKL